MYRSIALATVLSSAILAATGDTANAFHHRARAAYAAPYYPYYAGCCASSMMYGGGTYGGACMYGGGGCGNAYGSGCNTYLPCQGAAGGHRCCLRHRAKVAARRAFAGCLGGSGSCGSGYGDGCGDGCGGYGDCYGGCGGGCGDGCGGGCGDGCSGYAGGCSGCAGGGSGCSDCGNGQQGGDVIYDGPAAADQPAPPAMPPREASLRGNSQYQLVSQSSAASGNGAVAFDQGVASFRSRSFTNALQSFEAAATAEPQNAIYQYYRALTLFDLNGAEAGNEALQQAIELEKREAVPHWGKRMERVQGRGRLWIEKARREAGLAR